MLHIRPLSNKMQLRKETEDPALTAPDLTELINCSQLLSF